MGLLLFPWQALACSGPGAAEHILRSEQKGWQLWAFTLVFLFGLALTPRLRARGWRKQWIFALLILVHPGWWMSARSGDCGITLVEGSLLISGIALITGAIAFWRAGRSAPPAAP